MKLTMTLLSLILVFWNVENFFAPGGFPDHAWSSHRFYAKCDALAKTLLLVSDAEASLPDIAAFCEVGDASVLKRLLSSTVLRKAGYGIVHFDSPDHRGIDCALIYRRSSLRLLDAKPCHLLDSAGAVIPTRDILLVHFGAPDGESFHVAVNHHPSKLGDGAQDRRIVALRRLRDIADSLSGSPLVSVGDFNEPPSEASASLLEPSLVELEPVSGGAGTIKFNGCWEQIARCQVSEGIDAEMRIFDSRALSVRDAGYAGMKPLRTFSGPRYLGGVSDHYPIVVRIGRFRK